MGQVNPLDIVRRTPKTNCGQCGHPTCLAFAAAVAKTGENPSRCPYIDVQGLDIGPSAVQTMDDLGRERDLALIEHLKTKIAPLDFAAIAAPLGAVWRRNRPDALFFRFLGREVEVGRKEVLIERTTPEDHRDQILLYNYISSGGGRPPEYDWVGMESLPNSISKRKTLATYCEDRLAELFKGQPPERLHELGRQFAGVIDKNSSASLALIIPVLPMVPFYLLFWQEEPEDGFPARVKILFDRNVLDFLDLESLVFAAERMADRMAELAGRNNMH